MNKLRVSKQHLSDSFFQGVSRSAKKVKIFIIFLYN